MRDALFAIVLAAAATLISVGVAYYTFGAGLVTGGLLLAAFGWLVLGEGGDQ